MSKSTETKKAVSAPVVKYAEVPAVPDESTLMDTASDLPRSQKAVYLLAHTPRSGSTWLCDVLVQNKLGIPSLERAALFIGYGPSIKNDWQQRLDVFFAGNTSQSGLCGMKTDIAYLEHLSQQIPDLDYKAALFSRFTHVIHLKREDVIAQAVSWYLARATGQWTSLDEARHKPPAYSYDAIYELTVRLNEENQRWGWICESLEIEPLVLTYEDLASKEGMPKAVRAICSHLGVAAPKKIVTSGDVEKLNNPLQAEYAERFARGDH